MGGGTSQSAFSHGHFSAHARCALSFAMCSHWHALRIEFGVYPPPFPPAALFRVLAVSPFASTSCTAMAEKQIHKVVGAQQTKSAHSSLEQQAKAIIRVQWGSMRQRSD